MGKLTWQHITLIGLVIAAMFGASLLGKDFDTMGLLAILGALGFVAAQQQQITSTAQQVKEQTNGNLKDLLAQNQRLMAILAASPPIDPATLQKIHEQHMEIQQAQRPASTLDVLLAAHPSVPASSYGDTVPLPPTTLGGAPSVRH